MLSFEPKTPVSIMIVVDLYGWADNMMCKIQSDKPRFSLRSIQALLSRHSNYYRKRCDLHPTELKPGSTILPQLYYQLQQQHVEGWNYSAESIKSKCSIDKIKYDVMRVAVSVQECVKIDQASHELQSSPSFFISKIHKLALWLHRWWSKHRWNGGAQQRVR